MVSEAKVKERCLIMSSTSIMMSGPVLIIDVSVQQYLKDGSNFTCIFSKTTFRLIIFVVGACKILIIGQMHVIMPIHVTINE